VAMRRAAHQLVDTPLVFDDPLAVRIVGEPTDEQRATMKERESGRASRALRAFMAVRSRYAEDSLRAAVERGVSQYVLLGAGLDTFAYRNPYGDRVRVFEVDHPATQAWKQARLADAGIAVPPSLTFTPVNFERDTVMDRLIAAGFHKDRPAFFAWLGVTMYLERETVMAMFRTIASLPPASGVVFDYGVDRSLLGFMERMVLDEFSRRVAAAGEPWILFFKPVELAAALREMGFTDVEDLGPDDINARYFKDRVDGLAVGTLARLMKAVR
jgi:methyltransferase (TIGR00027 family)